ncbi:MAG: hypothetical protein K6F56_05250 [Oscillospiraceae bacterium]|nr:hypothetical protein [Oscillospiraceae bacterium]
MTRAVFKWIGKAVGAGLLALALLCLFCWFYYNVPVHYTNETGATEYKWEAGRFYSKGTEGFALGRTNNDGFNNLLDYTPGEDIDILLMGSSHMEGFNVAQDENAAARLNEFFGGQRYVYNIGTAGHTMLYCVKRLDSALALYAPKDWVLIETMSLDFAPEDMEAVVEGTYPDIPSHTGGLLTLLQKIPVLRLFYTKYVKRSELFSGMADGQYEEGAAFTGSYAESLERLLDKLASESKAHGVLPMVVYSPPLLIDPDGSAHADTDPEKLALFASLCREKGIEFLDLTQPYLAAYDSCVLPFGYSNTAPSVGHLNRHGHRIFAEAAAARIAEREG